MHIKLKFGKPVHVTAGSTIGDLTTAEVLTPAGTAIAIHLTARSARDPTAGVSGYAYVTSLDMPGILPTAANI
ncbi:MAG: hypothetical protein C5S49_06155 [Candidatus Methanogaster sp.]|nr:MAG: hypothetical protein C5S49_06155 [ANME-2 cluster archaeon]